MLNANTTITGQENTNKHGLAGLVLSLTVLPTLGITALPSLIVCLLGLGSKKRRKRSLYGILITCVSLILLLFAFITFTPPGSIPPPLNVYKFKRACSQAAFWLDFKKEAIVDIQSQNTFILVRHGAIHYRTEPGSFQAQEIIDFAEANGWKYHLSLPLFEEDFKKLENNSFDEYREADLAAVMFYFIYAPIQINTDCKVLAFETGNVHGYASAIFISDDGSEMVVYYYSPSVPDPAMKFWLPFGFEELREQRMQTTTFERSMQ